MPIFWRGTAYIAAHASLDIFFVWQPLLRPPCTGMLRCSSTLRDASALANKYQLINTLKLDSVIGALHQPPPGLLRVSSCAVGYDNRAEVVGNCRNMLSSSPGTH